MPRSHRLRTLPEVALWQGSTILRLQRGRRPWNPIQCLLGFLSLSGFIHSLLQTREGLADRIIGKDVRLNPPECSSPSPAQPWRLPGVVIERTTGDTILKAMRVRWSLRSTIWPLRTRGSLQTWPSTPVGTSKALGWLIGFSCQRRKQENWKVTTTAGTLLPSGLLVTQKLEKGGFLYGKNFIYYL